ncbi:MAG: molybdopterin biosynthesis protein [Syntrophomonadaceae bacterium]|nr:molybdopterin biosynthesis protein [Syntrophomonadaceae bacterium]
MQRNIYIENRPLEEAIRIFTDALEACGYFNLAGERIPVRETLGRVTSQPVYSHRSSPHYVASAMDGIAVKAEATANANELHPINLDPEEYLEVDTGDWVPSRFDAVVMIEEVNFIDGKAQLIKPAVPWQHVRSVGEDLVARDLLITSLVPIGPYEIASFITAALEYVDVIKAPRVAIIPTGTELREQASNDMEPGEIVESNSSMLAGLCRQWGAIPFRHDIVIDDVDLLRQAVAEVKDQADMIVICSGSSAGREDYSSSIVAEFGEVLVHGIATRPGKPAILGIIDNKPVIGVPGYPISAQLIFNLFARPIIYRKQGLEPPETESLICSMSRKLASSGGVDEFVYVNIAPIKDGYTAHPLNRGAGISTSLVKADGVLVIPRGNEGLQTGEKCRVELRRPRKVIDRTIISIGSHDICLDFLADILQKQDLRLVSANVGSMGGIMALRRGDTHFAGIHLLDQETGEYNISYLNRYLGDRNWLLVNLVKRQQGLIVSSGNPLEITTLFDLQQPAIRYINRQAGAGTRVLFDFLLSNSHIKPETINGYTREEYTHLAVAAAVKNNAADAALGIFAAAQALDLDFIPLAEERYDLAILPDVMGEKNIDILLSAISSEAFQERAKAFGGYSLELSGQIISENTI